MNDSFTVEDIHKIRVENYEQTKSMTHSQRREWIKAQAAPAWKIFFEMGGSISPKEADTRKRAEVCGTANTMSH